MVLVKLQGGLDNQMFQYALGRCVSVKNSCRLKLDLSFFQDHPERRYGLDDLSITDLVEGSLVGRQGAESGIVLRIFVKAGGQV